MYDMKSEVLSWRISADRKSELEREARMRKTSVSAVLDLAVDELLKHRATGWDDDEEQRRLHAAAEKCMGVVAGDDPYRSENASKLVRERLRRRYGR